jgi:hypothetical protein
MYVQPAGSKSLLPIRSATQKGHDTARFRYEAWEHVVEARASNIAAQQRIAATEQAIKKADQQVADEEGTLAQRGWTSAPACQGITVASTQDEPQPYDVVPAAQHDEIARRVCVRRVWVGKRLFDGNIAELKTGIEQGKVTNQALVETLLDLFEFDYLAPDLAHLILDELKPPPGGAAGDFESRQAQAKEFLSDWEKFESSSQNYQPHFGGRTDYLRLTTSSRDIAMRLVGPQVAKAIGAERAMPNLQRPSQSEVLGLVGASLDAYFGCLEDGRKQLKTKYDSWQALKVSAPERDRQKREFLVRECTQGLSKLEEMKSARKDLQAQLARDQQSLASASFATLTGRPQVLNGAACTQQ